MKKYIRKKSLALKLATGITALSIATSSLVACNYKTPYESANQTYSYNEVEERVKYWGGDRRFISQIFSLSKLNKTDLASHVDNNNQTIVVGYSEIITPEQQEQLNYVIDYFNSLFEVINPNYKFTTKTCKLPTECNIFVEMAPIEDKNVGATISIVRNPFEPSIINNAYIKFNTNIRLSNSRLRVFFAHELMHFLYGSTDIKDQIYNTFSMYNYVDSLAMITVLDWALEPKNESEYNTPNHLTKEQKRTFITLTPTDVGTLIAIYGDPTSAEKHNKYVDLLTQTHTTCLQVFGTQEQYFEKGFTIPQKKVLYDTLEK